MISHSYERKSKFIYHPNEIYISGYSGSGKTTLIKRLINKLSTKYSIAYVKHGAHKFEMDREGKDTDLAWKNGASHVFINDSSHCASIISGNLSSYQQNFLQLEQDFSIVEGNKSSPLKKIVLLDAKKEILRKIEEEEINGVIAYIGTDKSLTLKKPFFNRDDIDSIAQFVLDQFTPAPLCGLVLAGGKSSRMGKNKASLEYKKGVSQLQACVDLLQKFCPNTIVSCRKDQAQEYSAFNCHFDMFNDMGPVGGILSAMISFPDQGFLVTACDLPFLTESTIKRLLEGRSQFKFATTFKHDQIEPLCTIYEPKARFRLFQAISLGDYCPRRILDTPSTHTLTLPCFNSLKNINTPEEYQQALEELSV